VSNHTTLTFPQVAQGSQEQGNMRAATQGPPRFNRYVQAIDDVLLEFTGTFGHAWTLVVVWLGLHHGHQVLKQTVGTLQSNQGVDLQPDLARLCLSCGTICNQYLVDALRQQARTMLACCSSPLLLLRYL